ncbi:AAA family ATPase [Vibrio sp. WJH972]
MRPLTLTLSAFGPFPHQENIDFGKLGHTPFFLINGPTGSGKSTILDAICYALYGSTTGNERTGDQMRSDLASEGTETQVCFEFELGERRFRIERKPEQWLPKQRGTGLTRHVHRACLEQWVSEDWETVAVKPNPVNTKINELIGLSADQFRQVMVIPQGKFRDLLLASSKDREQIFGQLFSTNVYSRLESALAEQASGIRKEKDAFDQQLKGILDLVSVENEPELVSKMDELAPELSHVKQECDVLAKALDDAKRSHQKQEHLVSRFALRDQLSQQISLNMQKRTEIEGQRVVRDRALEAQKIAHLHLAQVESDKKVTTLSLTLEKLRAQEQTLNQHIKTATIELDKATKALEAKPKLQQNIFEIEQQQDRLSEIQKLQKSIEQSNGKLSATGLSITKKQEELVRYQTKLDQLERDSKVASDSKQQIALLRLELEKLSSVKKMLSQRRDLTQQDAKLNSQLTGWLNTLEKQQLQERSARAEALKLEGQWLLNQAANIAQTLGENSPCPVCGSLEHPIPAQFSGDTVTKEQVDKARQHATQSELKLKEIENTISSLRLELERISQQIKGLNVDVMALWSGSETELENHYTVTNNELNELTNLDLDIINQRLEKGRALVEQGNAELVTLDKQREQCTLEVASYQARLDTLMLVDIKAVSRNQLEIKLSELRTQVLLIDQHFEKAQKDVTDLNTQLTVIETKLTSGEKELQQSTAQHHINCESWESGLTDSPFSHLQEYQNAFREKEDIDRLSIEIKTFDELQVKLSSQLEQIKTELVDQDLPNLDLSQLKIERANEELVNRSAQLSKTQSRYDALHSAHSRLEVLKKRNQVLEEEYKILGTLSDVANGKNHLRVSLHRFVLGVLLDDVLIQASIRLQAMSFGRYHLVRKNERNKGNASSGLDLLVEDSYTSKTRDVATLSGGESFIAALSLALALSDVVQAHSGGVRLDTLFIDEGFGSLDTESLDLAIESLIELQKGGRTIGIISHVNELKEQMESRIDIGRSEHGSKITLISSQ